MRAPDPSRTDTPVKATDFESAASTNSATGAGMLLLAFREFKINRCRNLLPDKAVIADCGERG